RHSVVLRLLIEDLDRAEEVCAAADGLEHAEAARRAAANHCFLVKLISEPESRAPSAVPAGDQRALAGTPIALAGEDQRAGEAVRARVRTIRIEVAPLVIGLARWQRELVAHAEVEREFLIHLPIVLKIHRMAAELLRDETFILRLR